MSDAATPAEKKAEFQARWHAIVDDEKIRQLGGSKQFEALRVACAAHDWKPCSSLVCLDPILPRSTSAFTTDNNNKKDSLNNKCIKCNRSKNRASAVKANRERKLKDKERSASLKTMAPKFLIEDEATGWLVPTLRKLGFKATATLEFRKADVAVRPPSWPDGMWLRLQIKADGVYRDDGKTPRPNDKSNHGGVASFRGCTGYDGLLMVFVKSRLDAEGNIQRTLWVCNGDEIEEDEPNEHVDGTLGKNSIATSGVVALKNAIEASRLPRMTLDAINLEVAKRDHRVEVVLMLALRIAGFKVEFQPGNQTAIDCIVNQILAQIKTYNLEYGQAHADHNTKGKPRQPYTAADLIDMLIEGMIVKSDGKFYLMYAYQPVDALLSRGVFAHTTPYRGTPPSPGTTGISPPLGIYSAWLTGTTPSRATCEHLLWLTKPAFNWRRPVEIDAKQLAVAAGLDAENDDDVATMLQWIQEAAQEAACPGAFPSDELLARQDERRAQSDAQLSNLAGEAQARVDEYRASIKPKKDDPETPPPTSPGAGTSDSHAQLPDPTEPAPKRLCQSKLSFTPRV